jgi:hypothetical protein
LDKSYAIFQKYNGSWENTMSKNRSWLKIVVFYIRDLSSGNDNHIFGGIIEIYHACKWYLPKNTGFETRKISLAYRLGKFVQSLNQYIGSGNLSSLSTSIFWQIPLTSMVYFYTITISLIEFTLNSNNGIWPLNKASAKLKDILTLYFYPVQWYAYISLRPQHSKKYNIIGRLIRQYNYNHFRGDVMVVIVW